MTFPRRPKGTKGSVTAETAAVLPALMVVLAAGLWAVAAVEAQLECVDAARAGARAAARGESLERVRDTVLAVVPVSARVTVSRSAEIARVEVSVSVRPRWGASLPSVTVHAIAIAATEVGVER